MTGQTDIAAVTPAALLGDPHPLLAQLGAHEALEPLSIAASLATQPVRDRASLVAFVDRYRDELLVPLEWKAVARAYQHASHQHVRELVALDCELAQNPALKAFAEASCRVGQRQLSRLRPMRDDRLVQRYLQAIERGEARGWHTLVYGVALAVFSLPLRQGLMAYAEHTLGSFIAQAARPLALSEADALALRGQACAELPSKLNGHFGKPQPSAGELPSTR